MMMVNSMTKLEQLLKERCPDGVEYKKLGEVAVYSKTRIDASQLDETTYIGVDNLLPEKQGRRISIYVPEEGKLTRFQDGDVLIGNIRPYLKKIWLSDCVGGTNGDVLVVHIYSGNLLPKYLFYVLSSDSFFLYDMQNAKGAKMPRGSKDAIMRYQIPVPPLEVQAEIVRILDNFTELTAELTTELTARKKQYEYYRDSLLDYSKLKAGKKCTLLDLLSQPITDGPHTTPVLVEDGIPFISVESIFDGHIHFEKKRGNITHEFDEECCRKYKPQRHDVFMVKSGSTTGKVAYVDTDERFNIWSPIAALRVNKDNSPRYIFHLLQTKSIQSQVKSKASHGSQPNLGMRALEQFEVVVPPLEVQQRIVNVLDNFEAICSDLQIGLPAEIEARKKQYEYYRDLLLSFDSSQFVHVERERERERETVKK